MYLARENPTLDADINARLEFASLKGSSKTPGTTFEATANQLFCRNYINPWTPYKRVLNKSGTGLGKTFTALYVAKSFVDEGRPVIVIGYQQERFFDEIIHRPELGFVNKAEVSELDRLARLASSNDPELVKTFRDYKAKLLRRRHKSITFYGYGEFTNRVFDVERLENPKVNYDLIESLRYGLIICDEIHNAYNAVEQNNWGKTIQFAMNILGPDVYLLLLSATPLTNSSEITDFLNLLADSPGISIGRLKYEQHGEQKKVVEEIIDFTYPKIAHLALSKEPTDQEIHDRVRGKVIFVPDIGVESMPTRKMLGESIDGIKYFNIGTKFINRRRSPTEGLRSMRPSISREYLFVNRIESAPPMEKPATNTRRCLFFNSKNAPSTSKYQSCQLVVFISSQVVPCPGSLGTFTVKPLACRPSAQGRIEAGDPVNP